jgi:pyruvate dehydrogenase E2 component (dihydrolipoamide acetyltransferase)
MATEEFRLPDVGEGVAEGELVSWLVEPGDAVTEDQAVAEVETDKALVEIPSPYDGTVKELRAAEGEMVPVGTVIITFDVPDQADEGEEAVEPEPVDEAEVGTGPGAATPTGGAEPEPEPEPEPESEGAADAGPGRTFAPPSVRRLARELDVDLAAVTGSGPGGRVTEGDVRAAAGDGEDEAEAGGDGEVETGDERPTPRAVESGGQPAIRKVGGEGAGTGTAGAAEGGVEPAGRDRTLATPATRRLAEEEGVDVDDVPTEETRDGEAFVTADAVREYAAAQRTAQEADAAAVEAGDGEAAGATEAAAAAPEAGATATASLSGERVPYRGVRRTIGEQMERAKYTAPHVTHHDTADVTDLVAFREELKPLAEERGAKLTYTAFVMKAVVAALAEFPYVNAVLDEEADEIVLRDEYHVGVATATDVGLMVPVVEDVDRKGLLDVARETADLVSRARDRSIEREQLRGSTFTVTNVGVIGGEYATPIVNYPEVAILALGAIEERPRVVDGEVVPRHTLPLSLSIDHRVVDGAVAAEFTNRVIELLETPKLLVLE